MATKNELQRAIIKKIKEREPVIKKKGTEDGYFGLDVTTNSARVTIPFTDYHQGFGSRGL